MRPVLETVLQNCLFKVKLFKRYRHIFNDTFKIEGVIYEESTWRLMKNFENALLNLKKNAEEYRLKTCSFWKCSWSTYFWSIQKSNLFHSIIQTSFQLHVLSVCRLTQIWFKSPLWIHWQILFICLSNFLLPQFENYKMM